MGKLWRGVRSRLTIDRSRLRRDLLAALTVAAVAVPQDMAYAQIAGIPPQYGLYTGFVVTALAALFGSSAQLISGPTNAVSLVVFSALATLGFGPDQANAEEMIRAVWLLGFLVGTIQILIALLKLGDLTRYVSESVLLGFMAGAGVLIILGQVPNLLGIKPLGDGHLSVLQRLWLTLREGDGVDRPSALLGLGTLALLVPMRMLKQRLTAPFPDLLVALTVATIVAPFVGWHPKGATLEVERGLPAPVLPPLHRLDWIRPLGGSAAAIAVLGLLEAVAVAKAIAARTKQRLDFNRECLGQGLANLTGSFFQCMPGSGSLTRSNINYQAGAVSRWAGVMSAFVVAAALLLLAPLARHVPKPALAALLIITGYRLVDRKRLLYCLRATRYDAVIALSTAAAAILISVELSILIGICVSFLLFVPRAARLQVAEMVVDPSAWCANAIRMILPAAAWRFSPWRGNCSSVPRRCWRSSSTCCASASSKVPASSSYASSGRAIRTWSVWKCCSNFWRKCKIARCRCYYAASVRTSNKPCAICAFTIGCRKIAFSWKT